MRPFTLIRLRRRFLISFDFTIASADYFRATLRDIFICFRHAATLLIFHA